MSAGLRLGYGPSVVRSLAKARAPALEGWSSVDDVAGHFGVVRDSVYRWIESRGLPAYKIRRLWKFKLSEVDTWVRAGGADAERPRKRRQ